MPGIEGILTCPQCEAPLGEADVGGNVGCPGCAWSGTLTGDDETTLCWVDGSRECTSACASWDSRAPEDLRLNPCILINTGRSMAKNLGMVAKTIARLASRAETAERQRAIQAVQLDPPEVNKV